jgi:plasmid stability protein
MAQVIIRNIDDAVIARLRASALRQGNSLERELRRLITEAARGNRATFREEAAAFRRRLARRKHSDSTTLIRADRGR